MKIAFGGQMRSGKDTAAEYLVDQYGGRIMKFADPIYDILNYAQDIIDAPHKKDRNFLQWVGTDWARTAYGKDVWCDVFLKRLYKLEKLSTNSNFFVSDIRFPNELEIAKLAGFITIYINRPNREVDSFTQHSSETYLTNMIPSFDHVIHNEGSLEEFRNAIITLGSKYA